jgi:hypothetical protein
LFVTFQCFQKNCCHDGSLAEKLRAIVFVFQADFEEFLKQRSKETIIAAQKQVELINR